ncbi:MAG: precorrin-6y C5,15-methyltransferase (decarboxylating) subunit CbiE [Eubacteriaceae bacterium]|nr:precorrin-6y C5,15-methyltransferase (decarboxylating) subunit CbiE [Eubacteriaceae bacterium]
MINEVLVVGCGMGTRATMTYEAYEAIASSDVLIGSKRLIEEFGSGKECFAAISASGVADALNQAKGEKACVAVSGDAGFYSLARSLSGQEGSTRYRFIAGISSMSMLASRFGLNWDDISSCSLHGRKSDGASFVSKHEKSFFLLGGEGSLNSLLGELCDSGLGECICYTGCDLGMASESLMHGTAHSLKEGEFSSLSCCIVINPFFSLRSQNIPDSGFERGEVPMTKQEARSVIISSLALSGSDILYDIGAGTGSVSIEAAYTARRVYAIERNSAAISLIEANIRKHAAYNVSIVGGSAPEALSNLPVASKAFIGGSGGGLKRIVEALAQMNPGIRICISAITLETASEALEALSAFSNLEICQLSVSKARLAGSYHMMMGQNPVYIFTAGGEA